MSPDDILTGTKVFSLIVSVASVIISVYALCVLKGDK